VQFGWWSFERAFLSLLRGLGGGTGPYLRSVGDVFLRFRGAALQAVVGSVGISSRRYLGWRVGLGGDGCVPPLPRRVREGIPDSPTGVALTWGNPHFF